MYCRDPWSYLFYILNFIPDTLSYQLTFSWWMNSSLIIITECYYLSRSIKDITVLPWRSVYCGVHRVVRWGHALYSSGVMLSYQCGAGTWPLITYRTPQCDCVQERQEPVASVRSAPAPAWWRPRTPCRSCSPAAAASPSSCRTCWCSWPRACSSPPPGTAPPPTATTPSPSSSSPSCSSWSCPVSCI